MTQVNPRDKIRKKPKPREHQNKYAHLAPPDKPYSPEDKTYRYLPLEGPTGKRFTAGMRVLFHGRLYVLTEGVEILCSNRFGVGRVLGRFMLQQYVPDKIAQDQK